LSWGDYILFETKRTSVMRWCLQCCSLKHKRLGAWWLLRLPGMVWLILNILLYMGGILYYRIIEASEDSCSLGKTLLTSSLFVFMLVIGLSFFSYVGCLNFLAFSPVIRHIHQATRFIHQSWVPPRMLYITDGGVQDCTAITQLLRRRCERILLVLAASDPEDDLAVLRTTLQEATQRHKLAAFFDPRDARKDIHQLLDEYKADKSMPYMKIGIRYGWNEQTELGTPEHGTLWIVKNRLPEEFANQPVAPLLRESDFRALSTSSDEESEGEDLSAMTYDQLGGVCCCDCCHLWCNVGKKFPHLTFTGYMWLTPRLFSSLSRLGYALSKHVVSTMPAGDGL